MKVKVTEQGILIPKQFFEGIKEVEIQEKDGILSIIPIAKEDPIFQLGTNPISDSISDASLNHDRYLNNYE
jgi:virulence-associated protein VagC